MKRQKAVATIAGRCLGRTIDVTQRTPRAHNRALGSGYSSITNPKIVKRASTASAGYIRRLFLGLKKQSGAVTRGWGEGSGPCIGRIKFLLPAFIAMVGRMFVAVLTTSTGRYAFRKYSTNTASRDA